jgi:dihydroorotase
MLIRGGKVWSPAKGWLEDTDLIIEEGRIARMGHGLQHEGPSLDARGLVVAPGLVDLRAHLCEPGYESKETLASGSRAAAAGGFTSVVAMADTNPPIDNAGMVELVLRRARETACVHVHTAACATKGMRGEELTEMAELKEAGVVYVTENRKDIQSAGMLRRVLEYASMVGLPYVAHCENPELSAGGHMHEGYHSALLGIPAIPREAEETRIDRNIRIAEMTGAHIHIQHVSTRRSVEIIRRAKERGARVTAESCPQYWSLTDEAVRNFNSSAKVNPPLREADDVAAVVEGFRDGTLDCIATGHAPHTVTEKEVEFEYAPFGCAGLETALAAAITFLHEGAGIPLERVLAWMSAAPARIFGLDAGCLEEGASADLCIFDPAEAWIVSPSAFLSKGRNTPFSGMTLRGRVKHTLVAGRVAFGG